jgi:phage FluMu gp28-like protein
MRNVPYRQQEQVLYFICDQLPRFQGGAMDNRNNGNYLAERAMQRYGKLAIHRIDFTDRWYGEHFPRYKAALEDKDCILPASEDLITDHRDVVVTKGTPRVKEKRSKGTDKKQRHGDGAIAGCLAWYASCQEYVGNIIIPDFGLLGELGSIDEDFDFCL